LADVLFHHDTFDFRWIGLAAFQDFLYWTPLFI
jgi:hypothetical protein